MCKVTKRRRVFAEDIAFAMELLEERVEVKQEISFGHHSYGLSCTKTIYKKITLKVIALALGITESTLSNSLAQAKQLGFDFCPKRGD